MLSTTVAATSTDSTRLTASTGRPEARANSSSSLTAYIARPSTATATTTRTASPAKSTRSAEVVVVIEPNR